MPTALRPDHHIRIRADGDRLGIPLDLGDDLDVIEIREDEFLGAFDRPEAETTPKVHQTLLEWPYSLRYPFIWHSWIPARTNWNESRV